MGYRIGNPIGYCGLFGNFDSIVKPLTESLLYFDWARWLWSDDIDKTR